MNTPLQNGSRLKTWIIPILSLLLSIGGGYGGRRYADGETQQRIRTLEAQVKRHSDQMDTIGDRYVSLGEFLRRMDSMEQERRDSNAYLTKTLDGIRDDVKAIRR